jgi:hypothetical protein
MPVHTVPRRAGGSSGEETKQTTRTPPSLHQKAIQTMMRTHPASQSV